MHQPLTATQVSAVLSPAATSVSVVSSPASTQVSVVSSPISINNDTIVEALTMTEQLVESVDRVDNKENNETDEECNLCKMSSQHQCRKCLKPVCNLFCSVQDPDSDNESHRVHKPGDTRCNSWQSGYFVCPRCEETFASTSILEVHLKNTHEYFQTSFQMFSLISDGSLSDIFETCRICDKKFQNELDVVNHQQRVHEYGERFELYTCKDCGFRGTDMEDIQRHIFEEHSKIINDLEELGITRLPEISKRRKHDFSDLEINENGDIEVEEDIDDVYIATNDELLLLEEEDLVKTVEVRKRLRSKRKPEVALDVKEKKKRKMVTEEREKIESKSNLNCNFCDSQYTRRDNLNRHIKNKHKK